MRLPSCTIVLGRVKFGAASPTFKLVCGVGGGAGLAGDEVGCCAAPNTADTSNRTKLKATFFAVMSRSPLPVDFNGSLPGVARILLSNRLTGNVGEQKSRAGQVRTKRLFTIERLEHAVLPIEQVRVRRRKCFPALEASVSFYALVDEKNVGPGNRLVIEIGLAVGRRKAFQTLGKPGQSFQQRITTQI